MRQKSFFLILLWACVGGTLSRCTTPDGPASAPTVESTGEEEGASRQKKLSEEEAAKATKGPAPNTGVALPFFTGSDKGVVVTNIHWNQPLDSENPGADCELKARSPGVYGCVMKQGNDAVVLTLKEEESTAPHHLTKIVLDGKGAANRDRWTTELVQMGFVVQSETKGKVSKTVLLGPDQKTRAEVLWVGPQSAVTVSFRYAAPEAVQNSAKATNMGPKRTSKKAGR